MVAVSPSRSLLRSLPAIMPSRRLFLPSDIAGLVLWLRADEGLYEDAAKAAPAVDDGDAIYTWADQSGSGNDAVQATLANRPTLKLAIQNGKPVVRFDGTSDYLVTASVLITSAMWQRSANFSVLVVVRTATFTTGPQPVIALGQAIDEYSYGYLNLRTITIATQSNNRFAIGVRDNTNRQDDRWSTDNTINLVNNTFAVLSLTQSGSTPSLFVNGGSAVETHDVTGTISGASFANQKTVIGTRSVLVGVDEVFDLFLNGDIAELLVYNSALSTVNRQAVENHLNAKYVVY